MKGSQHLLNRSRMVDEKHTGYLLSIFIGTQNQTFEPFSRISKYASSVDIAMTDSV